MDYEKMNLPDNAIVEGVNATHIEEGLDEINSALGENVTNANTNLDDYTTRGLYYFSSDYTPTNIPSGSNGWLQVFASSGNALKQLWFRHGTNDTNDYETFVRTRNNGSAWSSWNRYILASEVNQIEAGNVTNISTTDNGYTDTAVTFSTAFSSTPIVTLTFSNNTTSTNYSGLQLVAVNRSTTGFTIRIISNYNSTATPSVSWIAVGSALSTLSIQPMDSPDSPTVDESEDTPIPED